MAKTASAPDPAPPAGPTAGAAYPTEIRPLVSLRFIALAWVVLNQFRFHLGLHAGDRSGLVFKGYLGAALFFVLAGFLAAHLWTAERARGRFRYGPFLWSRLIGAYPLHLAMIAAMAALIVAARLSGAPLAPGVGDLRGLFANLALVQAWGTVPTVSWNFPSWLISAEWFAYIALPVTAWIALKRFNPILVIAGAVALFAIAFEVAAARHVLFTDMTAQIGALQTVPAFLLGAGLYRLGRRWSLPRNWSGLVAAVAGAWIVTAALLRLSDLFIWPAFGALVFSAAETAKSDKPVLTFAPLPYLGEAAYSIYLVYLPVDILYFHAMQRLIGTPTGALAWIVWSGVFPVILLAGLAAHHLIARPAAAWLAGRYPFGRAIDRSDRFAARIAMVSHRRGA
ncbi:MAG TPA: acyltransferase [Caulobacteraceae bacterium]|jgi:peptidoglycan/LPS O-acetylase OafA/YrhL|nr:acyltransferase [Caulobacteraceae bacterium]